MIRPPAIGFTKPAWRDTDPQTLRALVPAVLRGVACAATVLGLYLIGQAPTTPAGRAATAFRRDCIYTAHKISVLDSFERLIGRRIDCVLVYNDASPNWAGWEKPWFVDYSSQPDYDWSQWATARGTNRQLIITQNLFPSAVNHDDWLRLGASGAYTSHAKILARNLVAAGLGNSIIRLGHEANGSWYPDSLGSTRFQWALWDEFWRQTALAMRSVPGAHFRFDWCIAALWRPIPLADIYPGDDVVDIIGVDAYDTGNLGDTPAARWNDMYTAPGGIRDVLHFARTHGKPISIPEWAVSPVSQANGFGDDPTFVNGIASVVRDHPVAYQSYFYSYGYATQLAEGPRSLAAYRLHFGAGGMASSSLRGRPPTSGPERTAGAPMDGRW